MKDRKEEKQISMWIPIDVHFNARIEAAKLGMNMKEYVIHLLKKDQENKNN